MLAHATKASRVLRPNNTKPARMMSFKKSATVKESIARQTTGLEEKSTALQSRLEGLTKERAELASKIDEDLLGRFERLFKSKGDAVVVALEHEVCTGCHM